MTMSLCEVKGTSVRADQIGSVAQTGIVEGVVAGGHGVFVADSDG